MTLDMRMLERLADAAARGGLADAFYDTVDTTVGPLLVVVTGRGVCRIAFASEDAEAALAPVARLVGPRILRSRRHIEPAAGALSSYLAGERSELRLPVDLTLVRSPFQAEVLAALTAVPRGSVTTYGELARRIGHPGAARAVGTALGRNPVPIVVPCHRVLPSTGGLGGYGGGTERKRLLLELEGVRVS